MPADRQKMMKEQIGLDERLDPQRESPESATADDTPVAAAAEPILVEAAEVEPVADRVEGVGAHPLVVERGALARTLEVREYETADECDRTERVAVVCRQFVLRAKLGENLLLLLGVLPRRDDARDEEHRRVDRRFVVLKDPVLQVLELFVAGTSERGMLLQGEAGFDQPEHRTGVAHVARELAPLGDRVYEMRRGVLVGDVGEEGVILLLAGQISQKKPNEPGILHYRPLFLVRKLHHKTGNGIERHFSVHLRSPFPKWEILPTKLAERMPVLYPGLLLINNCHPRPDRGSTFLRFPPSRE